MLINNKVQIRDNSSDLNEIRDDLRIKKLLERRDWIDKNKLRSTWGDVGGFKYGHAGGMGLGDDQGSLERLVSVGDQAAVVHVLPQNEEEERLVREYKGIGIHPLFKGMLPSFEKGALSDQINFAEDYAALLDYSLTEIYPYETIVGEYHWQLGEVRGVNSPNQKEVEELKKIARRYGADGTSATHTCADLGIGFSLGWGGILGKIRDNLAKFEKDGKDKEVTYLKAAEIVCKSIMRFISKALAFR
ncbi:MAG: hypothetical protein M1371_09940 [Actinobacteria bacterium]|nr:hypothetical protein [Actinomycetota bacterium]